MLHEVSQQSWHPCTPIVWPVASEHCEHSGKLLFLPLLLPLVLGCGLLGMEASGIVTTIIHPSFANPVGGLYHTQMACKCIAESLTTEASSRNMIVTDLQKVVAEVCFAGRIFSQTYNGMQYINMLEAIIYGPLEYFCQLHQWSVKCLSRLL